MKSQKAVQLIAKFIKAASLYCYSLVFILLEIYNTPLFASPWFTGPLLAPAGKTVPAGHINLEPYLFDTDAYGFYNEQWNLIQTPNLHTLTVDPFVTLGLTDFLDFQLAVPYSRNSINHRHDNNFSDVVVGLGIQALTQKDKTFIPDLRILLAETLPTGKYNNLNPAKSGADATGSGTYQTAISFNFQRLKKFKSDHYLRTRLSLTYAIPHHVRVSSFNSFGGGFNTQGELNPGKQFYADLAFEYTLTQEWVPVFEMLYVNRERTHFSGNLGTSLTGDVASIGHNSGQQLSFAPAIEYNINSQLGIIGGLWFTATGKNMPAFASGVIAVNYYL